MQGKIELDDDDDEVLVSDDASDGSDFDDDDDPDKIEVPGKCASPLDCLKIKLIFLCSSPSGGGRDLETASKFGSKVVVNKMAQPKAQTVTSASGSASSSLSAAVAPTANHTITSKMASGSSNSTNSRLPSGLVMKPNTTGYDVIKPSTTMAAPGMVFFFKLF